MRNLQIPHVPKWVISEPIYNEWVALYLGNPEQSAFTHFEAQLNAKMTEAKKHAKLKSFIDGLIHKKLNVTAKRIKEVQAKLNDLGSILNVLRQQIEKAQTTQEIAPPMRW